MRRVGAFVIASGAALAHAQPSAEQDRARALFEEGRKLIDAGDDAGACAKFGDAIRVDPDAAGTMLNLGLCNEHLHKYKTALFWFRKAQVRAHETNLPDYEKAAGDHTTLLAGQVATVKIAFADAMPPGARVRIDDDDIQETDFGRVEVDAGHHVLQANAAGFKSFRQELDVVDKGGQTLTIAMVAGSDVAEPPSRTVPIVLGAAALVSIGGAVALELNAESTYDKAKAAIDPATQDNLWHSANTRRYLAEGLGVAGVAAAGVAVWMYIRGGGDESRIAWRPYAGRDGAGLVVSGRLP